MSQKPVKTARPVDKRQVNKEKPSLLQRIRNYFKGVFSELRKVTWPSRKELINYTVIVIALTLILAVIIGFFDVFFKQVFFRWL